MCLSIVRVPFGWRSAVVHLCEVVFVLGAENVRQQVPVVPLLLPLLFPLLLL